MRQTYTGGEKMFVDYRGVTVPVTHPVTGTVTVAQIFVACLGASNYTFAEATASQTLQQRSGRRYCHRLVEQMRPIVTFPFPLR